MRNSVRIQDLEAVSPNVDAENRTIGFLIWYSISDAEVQKERLEELLKLYDLWEYMLNPIHPNDAFRRSAKSIEKNGIPSFIEGVTQNHLVSGFETPTQIVRHLVVETIDKNNQSLHYEPEMAIMKFDKETGAISYSSKTLKATELAEQVKNMYPRCLNNYGSRHIRELVYKILAGMGPIPVRPTGGVYFVPAKYETKLANLLSFLKQIGDSEGFKVPLVNSIENKDMVRQKLDIHIRSAIQEAANFLRDGSDNVAVGKKSLKNIREILKNYRDYEEACSLSFEEMNYMTAVLEKQAHAIIGRVTEIKESK